MAKCYHKIPKFGINFQATNYFSGNKENVSSNKDAGETEAERILREKDEQLKQVCQITDNMQSPQDRIDSPFSKYSSFNIDARNACKNARTDEKPTIRLRLWYWVLLKVCCFLESPFVSALGCFNK